MPDEQKKYKKTFVLDAIRQEDVRFAKVKDDDLLNALSEEMGSSPDSVVQAIGDELTASGVKPEYESPNYFTQLAYDIWDGLSGTFTGTNKALQAAAIDADLTNSRQGREDAPLSPDEQKLFEEQLRLANEARSDFSKGVPFLLSGLLTGGTAPLAVKMGAGPILTAALATGTDVGAYQTMTDLIEGKPMTEALGDGMLAGSIGFGMVGTGGVLGRAAVQRVKKAGLYKWLRQTADKVAGQFKTRTAEETFAMEVPIDDLYHSHPDIMDAFGGQAITAGETADMLLQRVGTDEITPMAREALATRLRVQQADIAGLWKVRNDLNLTVQARSKQLPQLMPPSMPMAPPGGQAPTASLTRLGSGLDEWPLGPPPPPRALPAPGPYPGRGGIFSAPEGGPRITVGTPRARPSAIVRGLESIGPEYKARKQTALNDMLSIVREGESPQDTRQAIAMAAHAIDALFGKTHQQAGDIVPTYYAEDIYAWLGKLAGKIDSGENWRPLLKQFLSKLKEGWPEKY